MTAEDNRAPAAAQQIKQCCATLYASDLARFLLGDSFHPGGFETTLRLAEMLESGAARDPRVRR